MNDKLVQEPVPSPTQGDSEPLHSNGGGVQGDDGLDIPEFLRRNSRPIPDEALAQAQEEVSGGEATEACEL